jgi:polysaccharide pyruvyl transferase WcaK-like protein
VDKKILKILFANHAQFEGSTTNLGDWAIFEQMVSSFSEEIMQGIYEINVPSSEPEFTEAHYPVKAFQRGGFKGIVNTVKAIKNSDIVLIGGGEIVQDKSSFVYIPYQLIRPFVAKLFRKKLFAYAIGVGEPSEISFLGKIQSKIVLNMFDIITVRDEKSLRSLRDYLKVTKPQTYLTADPAINLTAKEVSDPPKSPYFVVSLRSVYHRTGSFLPFSVRKKLKILPKIYFEKIELFKSEMAQLIDRLVKESDLDVYFLNTYIGKSMSADDDKFTNTVISRLSEESQKRAHVIDVWYTPSENKYVLSKAQYILSVPLHPLILGTSELVPVFSLAYASKNVCFMQQAKMSDHIYLIQDIQDQIDIKKVEKDILTTYRNRSSYVSNLADTVSIIKNQEKMNIEKLKLLCEQVRRGE